MTEPIETTGGAGAVETGPVEPVVEERGMQTQPSEARLRELIAARPYLGSWEEWAPVAYNRIPVMARMVMSHIYGRHDGTSQPYAYCVLCSLFRVESRPVVSSTRVDEPGTLADAPPAVAASRDGGPVDDEAAVKRAAAALLATEWDWRVGGPAVHVSGHYSADCPLCRPDYRDNAQRIVRVVLAAVRDV